jgi:hypothetical protein
MYLLLMYGFIYFVRISADFYLQFSKHSIHRFVLYVLVNEMFYFILLGIIKHFLMVRFNENICFSCIDKLNILFLLCFYKTYSMVIYVIGILKYHQIVYAI